VSLESVIGFLAYLEQKLRLKNNFGQNSKNFTKVKIAISGQTFGSHTSAAE